LLGGGEADRYCASVLALGAVGGETSSVAGYVGCGSECAGEVGLYLAVIAASVGEDIVGQVAREVEGQSVPADVLASGYPVAVLQAVELFAGEAAVDVAGDTVGRAGLADLPELAEELANRAGLAGAVVVEVGTGAAGAQEQRGAGQAVICAGSAGRGGVEEVAWYASEAGGGSVGAADEAGGRAGEEDVAGMCGAVKLVAFLAGEAAGEGAGAAVVEGEVAAFALGRRVHQVLSLAADADAPVVAGQAVRQIRNGRALLAREVGVQGVGVVYAAKAGGLAGTAEAGGHAGSTEPDAAAAVDPEPLAARLALVGA
jgi:hypothetical protein